MFSAKLQINCLLRVVICVFVKKTGDYYLFPQIVFTFAVMKRCSIKNKYN